MCSKLAADNQIMTVTRVRRRDASSDWVVFNQSINPSISRLLYGSSKAGLHSQTNNNKKHHSQASAAQFRCDTRYDTRCYFNVCSKADISEKQKNKKVKKRIRLQVSVNS